MLSKRLSALNQLFSNETSNHTFAEIPPDRFNLAMGETFFLRQKLPRKPFGRTSVKFSSLPWSLSREFVIVSDKSRKQNSSLKSMMSVVDPNNAGRVKK